MGIFNSIKNMLGVKPEETLEQKIYRETGAWNMIRPVRPRISAAIGLSSGELLRRGHRGGVDADQCIWLSDDDLCKNIVIMGGIGTGKTTKVINPLLSQFLRHDMGGLIFDIKGDFAESVNSFAVGKNFNRQIIKIGVGDGCYGVNLLAGLSPEQAASFLQSTFYLCGGQTNDSFWLQSATALVEHTLGIMQYLPPEYYTLEKCYQYIFFEDMRTAIEKILDQVLKDQPLTENIEQRNLDNHRRYYSEIFNKIDVKTRESIKITLSTVLAQFQNPELVDAFSSAEESTKDLYDLTGILDGDIVLVDLPLARWGAAAQVVYTLIKLRFFNLLQMRQVDKSMPQKYVFFMCDEYQSIISASKQGLSDLSFWDKSRSAKCIGVISTQSVAAFRSQIGDKNLTDTILANFRQKIFFKTEDLDTLEYMNRLSGRVEVVRESFNRSTSQGQSARGAGLGTQNQNYSESINKQIVERQLIDGNLLRCMGADNAVCFLIVDNESVDDILILAPRYVGQSWIDGHPFWNSIYQLNFKRYYEKEDEE